MAARALELFDQLVDLPPAKLTAHLEELCASDLELRAEVESLLAHDHPEWDKLSESPLKDLDEADERDRQRPFGLTLPAELGRYRLLEIIGQGGMGVVYRAEQRHPRREVAYKLAWSDARAAILARRLQREATTLARLRHPGIAAVYDADVVNTPVGSQPFIAMEFINGLRLPTFANEHNLNARQRLALMADIADAVHYAHQRGVIHRDLKPDNILVESTPTGPRTKVLDFGVARLTDPDGAVGETLATQTGQLVGTLSYMSPEQFSNEADARSDIYALGVITYELLTGKLPIDLRGCSAVTALQRMKDEKPSRLGDISQDLKGDIENIVAKALADDPDLRYASAAAFAEDIRRHLSNRPILATPPGLLTISIKFARRRRGLVAAVLAFVLAFNVGVAGLAWGLWRERQAFNELASVTTFATKETLASLHNVAGTTQARLQFLERLEETMVTLLEHRPNDPELLQTYADILTHRSNIIFDTEGREASMPLRRKALQLRERSLPPPGQQPERHADYATEMVKLGNIIAAQGDNETAADMYWKAHHIYEQLVAEHPTNRRCLDELNWSYQRVADVLYSSGKADAGRDLLHQRIKNAKDLVALHPENAMSQFCLASSLWSLAHTAPNPTEFERYAKDALDVAAKLAKDNPNRRPFLLIHGVISISFIDSLLEKDVEPDSALVNDMLAHAEHLLDAEPQNAEIGLYWIRAHEMCARCALKRDDAETAYVHSWLALKRVPDWPLPVNEKSLAALYRNSARFAHEAALQLDDPARAQQIDDFLADMGVDASGSPIDNR